VVVAHAEHAHLLGAEPGRHVAGVVLDQDRHEALDRAEERAVDHDRRCGRCRPDVLASKRWGVWKSSWMVDIWWVRPMASRAWTEILGP
jgi:hypothetical protein